MSIKELPPHLENDNFPHHVPVLLDAVLDQLDPKLGENYLDLTAGYGGHARQILARTQSFTDSVLVDRDEFSIENLGEFRKNGVELLHSDFYTAARHLITQGRIFSLILIDLGVSSPQLDQSERGFSFSKNGPLDMRMDRRQELSASDIVNSWNREDLAVIIRNYGEESPKNASKIASAIVEHRPFTDTESLGLVIKNALPQKRSKIHPATRTFQAIRIAVNRELEQVEMTLPLLPKLLKPGGRVAIISFHSLEDRLVKQYFADQKAAGYEAELDILTKKPLDGATYDVHNPRSRSAKLRVAVKK